MKKIIQPKDPTIAVFPYSIYLVSCAYEENTNITTVGWVAPLCNKPPLFGVSLRPSRYSYELIKNSKKFAINVPDKEILEKVDYCGTFSGKNVNKSNETNLTFIYTNKDSPPIIKECPINLECKLKNTLELGSHTLFIGEIEKILVDESIIKRGEIFKIPNFFIAIGKSYYGINKEIGKCMDVYKKIKK